MRKRMCVTSVLMVMLAFALVFNSFSSNVSEQTTEPSKVMTGSDSLLRNRISHRVTLVTGDVVIVTNYEGGREGISVIPADPTELGQNFQVFKIRNDTYVVPSSVDMRKVDVELFNIDLLIRDGYFNETHTPVIVQCESRPDPAKNVKDVEGRIAARGGHATFKSPRLPAVAANLPKEKTKGLFETLVESPSTRKIWLDRKVKVDLSESVPLIRAPDVWALDYNGSGIKIAVLDTGIDSTHPDFFFPNGTSKITVSTSFVTEPDVEDPGDYMGHGTHCASIAAGTGVASPIVSNWLIQPVILDGGITSIDEWSDAIPRDLILLKKHRQDMPLAQEVYPAKCWVKNDDEWLYLLVKVECSADDVDINDRVSICYFWGEYVPPWEHSDVGSISFGNYTFDGYGWDEARWYDDVEASPPGQNNTEGKASHDGAYYWFEFRKKLNSGDGYDWSIIPGKTVDGHLLLRFWDESAVTGYLQYISLKTSSGTISHVDYRFTGVAPGASLYNVKVLNREGWGYWSWIIAGIEYAAYGLDGVPETGDEADVISLSLGGSPTDGTDPCSLAVDAAVDSGVVVCVAAGNEYDYFWITSPGTARKAITVGASDKEDVLAWFSSKGPTIDFRVKPDVLAPGVDIIAARSWDARWPPIPEHLQYCQLYGTSMSTPHVAGVAALLLQGGWAPGDIKDRLICTALDLGPKYDVYAQGGGRIDAHEAFVGLDISVSPATVSFGAITVDEVRSEVLYFHNLNTTTTKTLDLTVEVVDVVTGAIIDCASLNETSITIPPASYVPVELSVNATVSKSLYSGKLLANDTDTLKTVHAIFGFARMNNVTINMVDRDGNPAAWCPIQILKTGVTSDLDISLNFRWIYTNENGVAYAYVADGSFYVVGFDWDKYTQLDILTIADKESIYGNTVVTLDERLTHKVDFDPNKPGQVFCSKGSSINYYQEEPIWWDWYWFSLWYYPTTTATYISSTTLNTTFSYEYYPSGYFKPAYPDLVDTPEWHNLLYWELGIASPIQYVADYTQLAKKTTDYKVGMTPNLAARIVQHKFAPIPMVSSEYIWRLTVPQSRVEYLSPSIDYWKWYEKYRDPPWVETPFWDYEDRYDEHYSTGAEVYDAWGAHPLSTHFTVWGYTWDTYSDLDMYGHFFQDAYGHSFYNWRRWPTGHLKIFRDTFLIYEGDESDEFRHSFYDEPVPSEYLVVIDGWSDQYLSTHSHTELEFTVASGVTDFAPPILCIRVPGLNLNNTHAAGDVAGEILIDDESQPATVTVEYSTDDGLTWNNAAIINAYDFHIPNLSDVYVSLRVNATDLVGNRISQTTIRGFYVQSYIIQPGVGLLRVEIVPPVVTTICIDGTPRNDWGLKWVKMPSGEYIISFTDVPGWLTPSTINVKLYNMGEETPWIEWVQGVSEPLPVYAGNVTYVTAVFDQAGYLKVDTDPALAATIYVDGVPMDDWGIWVTMPLGEYTVSFGDYPGKTTPPPQTVTVNPDETTHVIGKYT